MLGAGTGKRQSLRWEPVLRIVFMPMIKSKLGLLTRQMRIFMASFLRRAFNLRAGRLRLLPFVAVGVLAGAFLVTATGCTEEQVMETNLALGLNQMRADNGLPPLPVDASLSQVARYRAQDMATKDYFSHQPPDGCDYRCLMIADGLSVGWSGEVIAWNDYSQDKTVDITVKLWHDSPEHFAIITNPCFTRMGTGVAEAADGRFYDVAVFEGWAAGC